MEIEIRPETPADAEAIRQVNCLAFSQPDEAQLVDALREGGHVRLSLVAVCDGKIVGHLLFSGLEIVTEVSIPALALAPMVLPECQRRGIGSALVRRGLDLCRDAGDRMVIVLGHPEYYPRFGFSPELARPLQSSYSGAGDAWMAMELVSGAFKGVAGKVQYAPPFLALE